VFTNKKREGINIFACAVSIYVVERPQASIKGHELPLPISFGIVAYGFVGQPFSKQLYTLPRKTHKGITQGLLDQQGHPRMIV